MPMGGRVFLVAPSAIANVFVLWKTNIRCFSVRIQTVFSGPAFGCQSLILARTAGVKKVLATLPGRSALIRGSCRAIMARHVICNPTAQGCSSLDPDLVNSEPERPWGRARCKCDSHHVVAIDAAERHKRKQVLLPFRSCDEVNG